MTATVLSGCLGLIAIHSAADEPLAPSDLPAKVKQLIVDLDANRLSVRRAAEQQLLKIGPAALPHFPPPELISQPGVRQVLKRLRIRLETKQARLSAAASHITLQGKFPLDQILRKITEQTGNPINSSALPGPVLRRNVSIDFQKTVFWEAIDHLCGKLELRHRIEKSDEALQLLPADDIAREIAVTYSGPFRVAVTLIKHRSAEKDVRVDMVITGEPRIRSLFLKYAERNWSAQAYSDLRFPPRSPTAVRELPLVDGGRSVQLSIDFLGFDKPLDRISFDGKFSTTSVVGVQRIRFTDLPHAEGVARRRGGISVLLKKVTSKKTPSGKYDARIVAAVVYDAQGPAFESHRTWIYHNRVYLETAAGERIEFAGGQHTSMSDKGAMLIEYPFLNLDHPLSEYEFVYVAPTLIVDIPATVHFDDLHIEN